MDVGRDTQPTERHTDATVNDAATFRELAMKLIVARYTNPQSREVPQLLVGQLPPALPFALPLPEGSRMLGSLLQGVANVATIVFITDLSPDQIVDFYKERLTAAGWSEDELPRQQRGFVHSGSMGQSFARFLLSDTGPLLMVTPIVDEDGQTTTHLLVNPEGHRVAPAVRGMGAPHDMWSVLPAIRPPLGAWQSAEGGSGGTDRVISFARLDTALDLSTLSTLSTLVTHYQAQLERGGWKREDAGESGPIAWSTWACVPTQGEPWRGLFSILKQPSIAERYLLQVTAEWVGTQAGSETGPRMMGYQSHTTILGHHTATFGPVDTGARETEKGNEQAREDEAKDS